MDWGGLVSAGLSLHEKLGLTPPGKTGAPAGTLPKVQIETDASTGQRHLKLPVPSKDVLQGIAAFLSQLAETL